MNKTKKKIILAAIELFNEQGFANVRNQDISEKSGISLSNFNYHFGTKKELVLAVIDYMGSILASQVYGQSSFFTEGDHGLSIAKNYFEFERDFRFFYLDTHNILQTYPEIREAFKIQIEQAIQLIKNMNYLSIGKGYMKPLPPEMPDLYDSLARQIWVNNHFWFAQANIRDDIDNIVYNGLEANFAICYPYLTKEGIERFQAFIKQLKKKSKK